MFLRTSGILAGRSAILWERVTGNHIKAEVVASNASLFDLDVGTNIVNQTQVIPEGERRKLRTLQTGRSLRIIFDTEMMYRSSDDRLDVKDLIGSAFNTEEARNRYMQRLRGTGDPAFGNVADVLVEIDGIPQVVDPPSNEDDGGSLPIIIGAAAGGAALLAAVAFFVMRRRRRSPSGFDKVDPTLANSTGVRLTNEILVDNGMDDVSTLGDPMFAPGGMAMSGLEKDETVSPSIVSGDYDYAKAYGAAGVVQPSVSTEDNSKRLLSSGESESEPTTTDMSKIGMGLGQGSLFSDDSSFEEQFMEPQDEFEIIAPAGKLGMVIDTPSGGMPVVHAIKETSVLAEQVRVGDRLISVDEEDTTGMTAMQVSKLISAKSENPARALVFVRTRARANTDQ